MPTDTKPGGTGSHETSSDAAVSRGTFFAGMAALTAVVATSEEVPALAASDVAPTTPHAALQRLMDGNAAFVKAGGGSRAQSVAQRTALAAGQTPFASILTCADSRTAPEIFFHQGLGDIFVVRVAGNVATTTEIGSLEYGAAVLKTPLILVLGHSACGAVEAGIGLVEGKSYPGDIAKLVGLIEPAARRTKGKPGDWAVNANEANVADSIAALKRSSVLSELLAAKKVEIVGGYYDLATGKVRLL